MCRRCFVDERRRLEAPATLKAVKRGTLRQTGLQHGRISTGSACCQSKTRPLRRGSTFVRATVLCWTRSCWNASEAEAETPALCRQKGPLCPFNFMMFIICSIFLLLHSLLLGLLRFAVVCQSPSSLSLQAPSALYQHKAKHPINRRLQCRQCIQKKTSHIQFAQSGTDE